MEHTSGNVTKGTNSSGWVICILLSLFYGYAFAFSCFPAILIRQFMHEYSISASSVGVLSSIAYVASLIILLPIGIVMRYLSSRLMFFILCSIFLLSNLIFAFSYTYWLVILSRILLGLVYSGFFIQFSYVLKNYLGERELPIASSVLNFSGIAGGIVTMILFNKLVMIFNWHHVALYFFFFAIYCIQSSKLIRPKTE